MDDQLRCEVRLRDHAAKVAMSDRNGWMQHRSVPHPARLAVARALLTLAFRLAPTLRQLPTAPTRNRPQRAV